MTNPKADEKVNSELLMAVREWTDLLARSHFDDETQGVQIKPFVYRIDPDVKKIPKNRMKYYDFFEGKDDYLERLRKQYFVCSWNEKKTYKQKFYGLIKKIKIPISFESFQDALEFFVHYGNEVRIKLLEEDLVRQRQDKVRKLCFIEICSFYPHLLRFQPKPCLISKTEDIEYWVDRVQKYINVKSHRLQFTVRLLCYASKMETGEQCLRLTRVHSESGESIDHQDPDISVFFTEAKLKDAEGAFDYKAALSKIVA